MKNKRELSVIVCQIEDGARFNMEGRVCSVDGCNVKHPEIVDSCILFISGSE